jgi:Glycosyltransferase family 87
MRSMRSKYALWAAIFLAGAFVMVAQIGFWNHVDGANLEDVNIYKSWAELIALHHVLPTEATWQYPSGAAFLFLIPRIGWDYGHSFVALMLLFASAGLVSLIWLGRREGRDAGVWVWLLALPLLARFPVLRFDLAPTVIAIAALTVLRRRPNWFGALVGLGAMIKVWPILLLFSEWDRRRLLRSILVAAAVCALIFLLAAALWGNQTSFFSNQGARGLQVEAVSATPWALRQMITGELAHTEVLYGTNQIVSGPAEGISDALDVITVLLGLAAVAWWLLRDKAIQAGRTELGDDAIGRDFAFALVLWFVLISRVLSPQYLIWLVGLTAVVMSSKRTHLERPAWIVIGAVILSAGLYQSPANFVLRNTALVVAGIDAAVTLFALVWARRTVTAS